MNKFLLAFCLLSMNSFANPAENPIDFKTETKAVQDLCTTKANNIRNTISALDQSNPIVIEANHRLDKLETLYKEQFEPVIEKFLSEKEPGPESEKNSKPVMSRREILDFARKICIFSLAQLFEGKVIPKDKAP